MLALQDQFAGAPLMLADQAAGALVVAVGDGSMTVSVSVAAPPAPTLNALSLSNSVTLENVAIGTVVGALSGKTSGSTLSLADDHGGLYAISGLNIVTAAAVDFEAQTSPHNITVRETLAGATNTPRDTSFSMTITDVAAPSAAGGIANQTFTQGTAITPLDVAADFTIPAGSGAATYSLAPSSAALPSGLALGSGTGQITGTPTVTAAGVAIVVRCTTVEGFADTAFQITVNAAAPTLNALSLSNTVTLENVAIGTVVGALSGKTSGSTLSLTDDHGGLYAISGLNIVTAAAVDFEAQTSPHNITVRETLAGATNTPRDTIFSMTITDVAAPSAAGGIANQTFTQGTAITPLDVAADFTIPAGSGAATYSLAPASAPLPAGLALDAGTGQIAGTPTATAVGAAIVVRCTTVEGFADTAFQITVNASTPASFSFELVDIAGLTTFTDVPNLRVKIGAGAWQSIAAAGLTLTRTADNQITVSGFADAGQAASTQYKYEKDIPGEPNSAAPIAALLVRNTAGPVPVNAGLYGIAVAASDVNNPVVTA